MSEAQPSERTLTTGQIAEMVDGRLVGSADQTVTGLAEPAAATADDLTQIGNAHYARLWSESQAGAALVTEGVTVTPRDGDQAGTLIYVKDSDLAQIKLLEHFATPWPQVEAGGGSAVIAPTASVAATAMIGPNCTIGPDVVIGEGCQLHANVVVMAGSTIGDRTMLWPGVVVRERCQIGRGVILHPNVTIGADGFGYRPAADGRGLVKVPQIGTVVIGDGVEIGAGSCVDRGKTSATVIGDGTKIDNLVQIGHNCQIGRAVVICGKVGVAGSVVIGDGALLGGGATVRDHVEIGAGAQIGGLAGVVNDVPPGAKWTGMPAHDARQVMREWRSLQYLPEMLRRLQQFEKQCDSE